MNECFDLLFLCAGRGTRVGLDVPKQYVALLGKPVLLYSLLVYEQLSWIGKKIIVCDPVESDRLGAILDAAAISNYELVPGGATRQESVRQGLAHIASPRMISHNAAVPFVTAQMLGNLIEHEHDCVTSATEVRDNMVRSDGESFIPVSRKSLFVINSPQVFRMQAFKEAHQAALSDQREFNSDTELMLHYEKSVKFVEAPIWNFKITNRLDLALAEAVLGRLDLFPELKASYEAP